MKGKISVSPSEKSMASSTTTTTTTLCTEDSERRDSNCYFPDCRKDANCSCEICLDSLNATLDLMPLSVQKSSLTKLSYASSNFRSTVESTPTSFDPAVVTTPASVSHPISRLISPPKKKSKVSGNEEQRKKKTKKNERSPPICFVVLKVILVLGLVLCLELGFRWVRKGVLNPKFTEEIVRISGERSQGDGDLGAKLRLLEDELKGFVNNGELSSCIGSNSKWKINQDCQMLNSKCVLYKSAIEGVSIWGWPLQTGGLFRTGFSSSSITVLSGRVTEWSEGKFGYSIREANTSWGKTKWSTSVLQLDPNTWILEYSLSSVMESPNLLSLTIDLLTHMLFQAAKNVNRELFWMFSSASGNLYSEAVSKASTMTPT